MAMPAGSGGSALSCSSSKPRLRLRPRSASSVSSRGSDESEALGVDLSEGSLLNDLVLRSGRADMPEEAEEF